MASRAASTSTAASTAASSGTAASRRQSSAKTAATASNGSRRKNAASGRIPRPMNSFMCFAKVYRPKLQRDNPGTDNKVISVELGRVWKQLSPTERQTYITEAERLAAEHKRLYPDWKFTRVTSKTKKKSAEAATAAAALTHADGSADNAGGAAGGNEDSPAYRAQQYQAALALQQQQQYQQYHRFQQQQQQLQQQRYAAAAAAAAASGATMTSSSGGATMTSSSGGGAGVTSAAVNAALYAQDARVAYSAQHSGHGKVPATSAVPAGVKGELGQAELPSHLRAHPDAVRREQALHRLQLYQHDEALDAAGSNSRAPWLPPKGDVTTRGDAAAAAAAAAASVSASKGAAVSDQHRQQQHSRAAPAAVSSSAARRPPPPAYADSHRLVNLAPAQLQELHRVYLETKLNTYRQQRILSQLSVAQQQQAPPAYVAPPPPYAYSHHDATEECSAGEAEDEEGSVVTSASERNADGNADDNADGNADDDSSVAVSEGEREGEVIGDEAEDGEAEGVEGERVAADHRSDTMTSPSLPASARAGANSDVTDSSSRDAALLTSPMSSAASGVPGTTGSVVPTLTAGTATSAHVPAVSIGRVGPPTQTAGTATSAHAPPPYAEPPQYDHAHRMSPVGAH